MEQNPPIIEPIKISETRNPDLTAVWWLLAMALVNTAWPFLVMFTNGTLTACPFTFSSLLCAGYSTSWIAYFVVGGGELIFWLLSWASEGTAKAFYWYAVIFGMWGTLLFQYLPLLLWCLAIIT